MRTSAIIILHLKPGEKGCHSKELVHLLPNYQYNDYTVTLFFNLGKDNQQLIQQKFCAVIELLLQQKVDWQNPRGSMHHLRQSVGRSRVPHSLTDCRLSLVHR